ncbi:hypothetical protein [Xanthomonas arboricola]|uniref:hypothetical protein n=1 Tax=Xanthomonas arboricola TaxID=56448 RepID=UPI000AB091E7|nr:hypothetical protein [Xanthomonas arboricola]
MNELLLTIGMISFPGVIAVLICEKIVVHARPWDLFKYGVYTFVFGLSCYFFLQLTCTTLAQFGRELPFLQGVSSLKIWSLLSTGKGGISYQEIAWATTISPVLALTAAVIVNEKVIHKLAQKLHISRKFGDENLFSYFLNSPSVDWVYIRDIKNNLTYQGLIGSFAETKEMQEIVLADVSVYEYQTSDFLYSVPYIYLCSTSGSFVIEAIPPENLGVTDG